ncbi:carbamoyl phosphate synthase small subunit [Mobilitalea sibirica]|uniref:Carbamoyl phosphate synthase small chain n=1 Tax=Mobilitalea sibirica TaxID=1462919 RepID=A0A8J7H3E3_9FIRM|nr:carbamoyl phosphate synthase small subunit [Mobilitalea sibirica]MBH1941567.1 carbamoyl phosphate synthase small subunit [Mobilitalea sibirica]
MKAFLILEDGNIFTGEHIGSQKEIISEIVFNTGMTGYLEVLTDPSYAGQSVVMTYPLIGNYGICKDDMESKKPWVDAFIVRELSRMPSNFRNEESIQSFLERNNIPGIAGIDTRALVKLLRSKGTMNGMLTTNENFNKEEVLSKIHQYKVAEVIKKTTGKQKIVIPAAKESQKVYKVALMDYGMKLNIARSLAKRGCEVTIYPAFTASEEVLMDKPDGIMLSNGPGDPKECKEVIAEVKKLYDSDVPIFAICLGHQLLALANGGDTEKMKYGHRGANHPVKDLKSGRVYISTQNHGYMVKEDSIPKERAKVSFINVNDKTVEGLRYLDKKVFSVQFHPEACAGPMDSEFLFDEFINMMEVQG